MLEFGRNLLQRLAAAEFFFLPEQGKKTGADRVQFDKYDVVIGVAINQQIRGFLTGRRRYEIRADLVHRVAVGQWPGECRDKEYSVE